MLKIVLKVDGTEKTYTESNANLKHMKKCAAYLARIEDDLLTSDEQFEEAIALVCDIFKDENVNYETVMEGLSPDDWNETIMDIIFKVVDGETKKKGKSSRLQMIEAQTKKALQQIKEKEKESPKLSGTT